MGSGTPVVRGTAIRTGARPSTASNGNAERSSGSTSTSSSLDKDSSVAIEPVRLRSRKSVAAGATASAQSRSRSGQFTRAKKAVSKGSVTSSPKPAISLRIKRPSTDNADSPSKKKNNKEIHFDLDDDYSVTVGSFCNTALIGIRQISQGDDDEKTEKAIVLNQNQWQKLKELIPTIEQALKKV